MNGACATVCCLSKMPLRLCGAKVVLHSMLYGFPRACSLLRLTSCYLPVPGFHEPKERLVGNAARFRQVRELELPLTRLPVVWEEHAWQWSLSHPGLVCSRMVLPLWVSFFVAKVSLGGPQGSPIPLELDIRDGQCQMGSPQRRIYSSTLILVKTFLLLDEGWRRYHCRTKRLRFCH